MSRKEVPDTVSDNINLQKLTNVLALGSASLLLYFGLQWALPSVTIPETVSPTELGGAGYRVTRSELGHNILEVEGFGMFPAGSPYDSALKGEERIRDVCGPVILSRSMGSMYSNPTHVRLVAVQDAEKCFPK